MRFSTSNPTLRQSAFQDAQAFGVSQPMTIQGTINKCFILLGLIVVSASWIWKQLTQEVFIPSYYGGAPAASSSSGAMGYVIFGAIAGLILAIVTCFNQRWAKFTAPLYALCEGLVLGAVSVMFEKAYPGIVIQAVALTFGVMFCMLGIYKSGLIKVDQKFMIGISAATGAICLVYLVSFIMGFFGRGLPLIYSNGPIGIGFSVIVCAIAAFNLIMDFWIIENGAKSGAPKYMEWYGAFALMVTLVWLYMEILRLLAKMNSRR